MTFPWLQEKMCTCSLNTATMDLKMDLTEIKGKTAKTSKLHLC